MFPGADLAGVDWVASHLLLKKQNIEKLKKVVNIMAEVKVNSQHRCLTVISTRVHCKVRYTSIKMVLRTARGNMVENTM